MQAILDLVWRLRIILGWLAFQVLSLSAYISFSMPLRLKWQAWWWDLSASVSRLLSAVERPFKAIQSYERLRAHQAELLSVLAEKRRAQGPAIIPIGAWGDLRSATGLTCIPAEILYQTVMLRENILLIDRGSRDSLVPGLCVINDRGIVGIIAETSATYSKVLPLFNTNLQLAVTLPRSGYLGLSSWQSGHTLNQLTILYVPYYANVEVGDEVWSGPQSTLCPSGLRVGRIHKIEPNFSQGFHQIWVQTYIDWFDLGPLYVLKPKPAAP